MHSSIRSESKMTNLQLTSYTNYKKKVPTFLVPIAGEIRNICVHGFKTIVRERSYRMSY